MLLTIDGPSGTGKSSVARHLAEKLGWNYYNTGALYRALGAWMLQNGWITASSLESKPQDPPLDLESRLSQVKLKLTMSPLHYWVNDQDMTASTIDQSLALLVSRIAAWPAVRAFLLDFQRELGRGGHAIFDGRDMGSVVFPDADLKIFMTASAAIRAQRRHLELISLGHPSPGVKQICLDIEQRDRQDSERSVAPLKRPEDAHLIDTTSMSLEQVVEVIQQLVRAKGSH